MELINQSINQGLAPRHVGSSCIQQATTYNVYTYVPSLIPCHENVDGNSDANDRCHDHDWIVGPMVLTPMVRITRTMNSIMLSTTLINPGSCDDHAAMSLLLSSTVFFFFFLPASCFLFPSLFYSLVLVSSFCAVRVLIMIIVNCCSGCCCCPY